VVNHTDSGVIDRHIMWSSQPVFRSGTGRRDPACSPAPTAGAVEHGGEAVRSGPRQLAPAPSPVGRPSKRPSPPPGRTRAVGHAHRGDDGGIPQHDDGTGRADCEGHITRDPRAVSARFTRPRWVGEALRHRRDRTTHVVLAWRPNTAGEGLPNLASILESRQPCFRTGFHSRVRGRSIVRRGG